MGRKILFITTMIVSIIAMAFCFYLFCEGSILALVVAALIFAFMCFVAYRAEKKKSHEWCDKDFIRKYRVR